VSDHGPFRIRLIGLHYQRDLNLDTRIASGFGIRPGSARAQAPALAGHPAVIEQFYAQIQVLAEPRLTISQGGPLKILEAVDDRGESLVMASSGPGAVQRSAGYFGVTAGSMLQIQAHLLHPKVSGQSIARLRGTIPLVVATRKLSPLVVPLTGATGQSFRNDEVTLAVRDIRTNPDSHQIHIELMIRPTDPPGNGFGEPSVPGLPLVMHRPEAHQQQIEIVDAQGRAIPWYHSSFDAEGSRFTLTLTPHDQATPAKLRYYGLAYATTEVSIEFFDVPML
jgi:hypothetical protein